ncbi:D-2-hydroxyacid dehydrogenase [Roseibacillus persicicus]|uniref:Glycerate dehydrogenase n=1 Tax=Roseibacillus persicicus TaxID=454148 RepID=A0A918WML7_9BACT|nr:D-2-hydroxyacid dehydrogenase [Roseibacillus persicicus]GHC57291.1 glycerate dehydrogenase [Roseibacillus persicicus]
MKKSVVILDLGTVYLTESQQAWLARMGEAVIYDRTSSEEMLDRLHGVEIALTTKCPFDAALLDQLPDLKYIGVLGTGYDMIDVAAAREGGITVASVPTYCTAATAQHVFALLLAMTNHVGSLSTGVRQGRWCEADDFSYWDKPLEELEGMSLGIVGFGRIGRKVAKLGDAFGMEVIVRSRSGEEFREGYVARPLNELLGMSDVVTLHCPLTSETHQLMNEERLALMKKGSRLINAGRGKLVDEAALAEALRSGHLRSAAVDVLSSEPPSPDNPLLNASNCIVTPHVAWATTASIGRLLDAVLDNLESYLKGEPKNEVLDFEKEEG